MSEMEEYANKLKVNKTTDIKNMINVIHDDLAVAVVKSVIPESIFVEYFLDFFKSGGHMDVTTPLTLKWVELAKGPYNEVDVVDAKGVIIYTIPSLYARPTDDSLMNKINFSEVIGEYNLRSKRLHSDGINYVNNKLNGIDSAIVTEHNKHTMLWENIFNRYNKEKKTLIPKTNKVEEVDFLDFD